MNRNDKEATEEHTEAALVRLMLTLCLSGADWTLDTCGGSLCFLKYAANNHHGNKCRNNKMQLRFYAFCKGGPCVAKRLSSLETVFRLCITLLSRVAGQTPAGCETSAQPVKVRSSFFPLAKFVVGVMGDGLIGLFGDSVELLQKSCGGIIKWQDCDFLECNRIF